MFFYSQGLKPYTSRHRQLIFFPKCSPLSLKPTRTCQLRWKRKAQLVCIFVKMKQTHWSWTRARLVWNFLFCWYLSFLLEVIQYCYHSFVSKIPLIVCSLYYSPKLSHFIFLQFYKWELASRALLQPIAFCILVLPMLALLYFRIFINCIVLYSVSFISYR